MLQEKHSFLIQVFLFEKWKQMSVAIHASSSSFTVVTCVFCCCTLQLTSAWACMSASCMWRFVGLKRWQGSPEVSVCDGRSEHDVWFSHMICRSADSLCRCCTSVFCRPLNFSSTITKWKRFKWKKYANNNFSPKENEGLRSEDLVLWLTNSDRDGFHSFLCF